MRRQKNKEGGIKEVKKLFLFFVLLFLFSSPVSGEKRKEGEVVLKLKESVYVFVYYGKKGWIKTLLPEGTEVIGELVDISSEGKRYKAKCLRYDCGNKIKDLLVVVKPEPPQTPLQVPSPPLLKQEQSFHFAPVTTIIFPVPATPTIQTPLIPPAVSAPVTKKKKTLPVDFGIDSLLTGAGVGFSTKFLIEGGKKEGIIALMFFAARALFRQDDSNLAGELTTAGLTMLAVVLTADKKEPVKENKISPPGVKTR